MVCSGRAGAVPGRTRFREPFDGFRRVRFCSRGLGGTGSGNQVPGTQGMKKVPDSGDSVRKVLKVTLYFDSIYLGILKVNFSSQKVYFCALRVYFCVVWKYALCTSKVFFRTLKLYFCTSKLYFCTFKRILLYSESILLYFESILCVVWKYSLCTWKVYF